MLNGHVYIRFAWMLPVVCVMIDFTDTLFRIGFEVG